MAGRAYQGISLNQIDDKAVRDALRAVDLYLRDQRGPTSSTSAATGGIAQESFVVLATASTLTDERVLVVTPPLAKADSGPGGTITLSLTTALLGGTPALTYGTTVLAGSAATFIRTDDRVKFPSAIMSPTSSFTLVASDDATDLTLTAGGGVLKIVPGTGIRIDFPNSADASLVIAPNTTTAAGTVAFIQGRPAAGTRALLTPNWFSPGASDVFSGQTFRSWDHQMVAFAGQHTTSTFVGYDISLMSLSPSSGSGVGNKAYGFRGNSLLIGNTNATWDEIAMGLFTGPTRSFGVNPTVTVAAGLITEPAVVSGTKQVGLLVRQRTAGQTATDRLGIDIEAQNSGTNRWGMRSGDRLEISSPAALAITVLDLNQLATGATAGAHINMDDKAGDPPSPVTGDLWRNGNALYFRQAAATVDLTAAAAGGGDSFLEWAL